MIKSQRPRWFDQITEASVVQIFASWLIDIGGWFDSKWNGVDFKPHIVNCQSYCNALVLFVFWFVCCCFLVCLLLLFGLFVVVFWFVCCFFGLFYQLLQFTPLSPSKKGLLLSHSQSG